MREVLAFFRTKAGDAPLFAGAVVFSSVLFLVFGVWLLRGMGRFSLPPDFVAARLEAAAVSQEIALLARETNERVTAANRLEREGKFDKAKALVEEAREKNRAASEQALLLSRHLERMARSLGAVRPAEHQQLAYEAITVEISLISEFMSYTRSLNTFLDGVSQVLATRTPEDGDAVTRSLAMVNDSADKINRLNQEFISKMSAFDRAL